MKRISFVGLAVFAGLSLQAATSMSGECKPTSVGLDTTLASGYGGSNLGHSVGQSFLAPTRLLRSIAVWRAAIQATNAVGMHLYIVAADSAGRPQLDQVVLDGPTLVRTDGDGVHDTEFRWTFDPLLELPGTGTYAFFLRQDPCTAYFDVIATDEPGAYPQGQAWSTQRADLLGCRLRAPADSYPDADLIFNAEFCSDAVPVQRRSWGQVKTIYR
jgi:hypothetical protein